MFENIEVCRNTVILI